MEYIEIPSFVKTIKGQPSEEKLTKNIKSLEDREIEIKKAQIRDTEEIIELVNGYAAENLMLPRGPQYIYENIRDFVIAVDKSVQVHSVLETKEVLNLIVGCGSLHVLWEDIAEIRALAIKPKCKNLGIGSKIIELMKSEAKLLGIRKLFTFTVTEDFFKTLGFRRKKREELPAKVWGECSRCPKFFKCDEVGMMLDI